MKTKLLNIGTCGTVGFHFIVCGLPLIVALLGGSLSFTGWISKPMMTVLLALSGTLIAISAIAYIKNKCDCSPSARRFQTIMLIIVSLLYATAVAGHFGVIPNKNHTMTEVEACH